MNTRSTRQSIARLCVLGVVAATLVPACRALATEPLPPNAANTPAPRDSLTLQPTDPLTNQPTPLPTLQPTPTPAPTAVPANTSQPSDVWIDSSDVIAHPDGVLYSGDLVSFQVQVHNGSERILNRIPFAVDWGTGRYQTEFGRVWRGATASTSLLWVWDTAALVGTHTVTVTVDPNNITDDPDLSNNVAVVQVTLLPERPAGEAGATWQTASSECCTFYYIGGTAAARDIDTIAQVADRAVAHAEERMALRRQEPIDVYLIDRVLGHGGFASNMIVISYLDRDYSGGGLLEVMRHETTHILDRANHTGERPVFLVEGLAVFITGGHFKLEPLPERAAALERIGAYIPLRRLANNFYPSQHETGYLEAGAFLEYLVRRNGYDTFIEFYDGMARQPGDTDAGMIDREMTAAYGIGLDEMEAEWLAHLRTLDTGDWARDVATTIAFYDTLRRYQQRLDPSAYFLDAWMPNIRLARERGLTADYTRHPRRPENIALEAMLVAAHEAFIARDFDRSQRLLASINAVLEADAVFGDPTAANYLAVVQSAMASRFDPKRISFEGDQVEVWAAREGDASLVRLRAEWQNGAWTLQLSQ
jgi:hypothetical protein